MSEVGRRRVRPALVVGFVAALLVLATISAVGYATVALPGCESCHLGDAAFAEPTRATAHAKANTSCVACHVDTESVLSRTQFGFFEVFGMWTPLLDPATSDTMRVQDPQCLGCHRDVTAGTIEAKGMRIAHASCAVTRACTDCHSEVGHGSATPWPRVASMNDCVACHKERTVSVACETCHTGRRDATASSKPEFSVTHGPQWQQTHGMGDMRSCSQCHAEDKCGSCHGPGVPHVPNFVTKHAEVSKQEGAKCSSCHDDAFCDSCHLTPMPHSKDFIASHKETVDKDGDKPCLRCHTTKDCDTCHVKHVHPGGSVGTIPSPSRGDGR